MNENPVTQSNRSRKSVSKRILFLVPYPPGIAPSQRFRFEQYLAFLNEDGFEYHVESFLDKKAWDKWYHKKHYWSKFIGLLRGYARRWLLLFSLKHYDFIFVHRETSPAGPPLIARIMTQWMKKKMIFDFDDAIWMDNVSDSNAVFGFLKSHSNCRKLMKWSWKNSCGNHYLQSFARQYNSNSFYLPTTIDTENLHNRVQGNFSGELVIGWTGTHSTIHNLHHILPALREVFAQLPFRFLFISDAPPDFEFPRMTFKKWKKDSEIDDLLEMHIGLMPLADTEWSKGKCGLKILQYMSLGIVPVVSDVGVNSYIVSNNVNGFSCKTPEDWSARLRELHANRDFLASVAAKTRARVEQEFSTASQRREFLRLFAS